MRSIIFETKIKKWAIRVYERQYKTDKWIAGDVVGEWIGDSFIKYDRTDKGGTVAYDFPERLPKYLKDKVKSVLNMLQKAEERAGKK